MDTLDLIANIMDDDVVVRLCETRKGKYGKFLFVGIANESFKSSSTCIYYGCGFDADTQTFRTDWTFGKFIDNDNNVLDKILVIEQITTLYRICNENNEAQEVNNSLEGTYLNPVARFNKSLTEICIKGE